MGRPPRVDSHGEQPCGVLVGARGDGGAGDAAPGGGGALDGRRRPMVGRERWGGRREGGPPPPGPLRRTSALARSKSDATGWLAGLGGLAGGAVTRAGSSKGKVYRAKQLNRTVSGGARKKPSSASPQRAPLARSKSDATGLLRGLGPARGPGAATGSPKVGGSRAKQLNRTVSGGPGKRKVSAAHRRSKSRDQVDAVVRPAAVTGAFSKEFWQR